MTCEAKRAKKETLERLVLKGNKVTKESQERLLRKVTRGMLVPKVQQVKMEPTAQTEPMEVQVRKGILEVLEVLEAKVQQVKMEPTVQTERTELTVQTEPTVEQAF